MEKVKAVVIKQQPHEGQEFDVLMQESHYVHTINDFVSLIEEHGFDKVMNDLRKTMGERSW